MVKETISKEDFLTVLKSLSKEEITKLIIEKGKEPKLVKPIVFLK